MISNKPRSTNNWMRRSSAMLKTALISSEIIFKTSPMSGGSKSLMISLNGNWIRPRISCGMVAAAFKARSGGNPKFGSDNDGIEGNDGSFSWMPNPASLSNSWGGGKLTLTARSGNANGNGGIFRLGNATVKSKIGNRGVLPVRSSACAVVVRMPSGNRVFQMGVFSLSANNVAINAAAGSGLNQNSGSD